MDMHAIMPARGGTTDIIRFSLKMDVFIIHKERYTHHLMYLSIFLDTNSA